jgi:hypothetical protein
MNRDWFPVLCLTLFAFVLLPLALLRRLFR